MGKFKSQSFNVPTTKVKMPTKIRTSNTTVSIKPEDGAKGGGSASSSN